MAQVIDLAAARKARQPKPPAHRVALPRLGRKAAKRLQQAQAVRLAAKLAL